MCESWPRHQCYQKEKLESFMKSNAQELLGHVGIGWHCSLQVAYLKISKI